MTGHRFDDVDEITLRRRQSAKWMVYPPDVLPAWVAEMDFPLADPIRRTLQDAVNADDAGYACPARLGDDFAAWAQASWGWRVAPADVHLVADVVTGIAEILRVATGPGDGVVIEPPVYPPFAATVRALGRRVVPAPFSRAGGSLCPDLRAIERAYSSGARAHLLCSPHNPTGFVYPTATLARIAELADAHDVLVLADEIHAPLTLPGGIHTPMPLVSAAARRRSLVLTSASKAWNIAGLKAAVMVGCDDLPRAVLAKLPPETPYHAGHLGVLASRAAFREGAQWLSDVVALLDRNRRCLRDLLSSELPRVEYMPPQAGYLAWLDCRALGLGADPARVFLERGRVALSSGPTFGVEGEGFARLNFATPRRLLEEAVRRMKRSL
jgi:cysteine-S-conjugate beta-lyase